MGEDHDQQAEEHQVEHQPGHQEPAPPHTHTVRGHAAVRKVLNQFNTEIREKCFFFFKSAENKLLEGKQGCGSTIIFGGSRHS